MTGENWDNLKQEIIMNAFRDAGIYSFLNNAIPIPMLTATTLTQWENQKLQRFYQNRRGIIEY